MVMYWLKSRKEVTTDLPQYQRDFDLSPQDDHSMFWEYLEVGKYMCQLRFSAVREVSRLRAVSPFLKNSLENNAKVSVRA